MTSTTQMLSIQLLPQCGSWPASQLSARIAHRSLFRTPYSTGDKCQWAKPLRRRTPSLSPFLDTGKRYGLCLCAVQRLFGSHGTRDYRIHADTITYAHVTLHEIFTATPRSRERTYVCFIVKVRNNCLAALGVLAQIVGLGAVFFLRLVRIPHDG